MPLFRLAYTSAARQLAPADIEAILAASRRNNGDAGITGMLLFDSDIFLQVLEGAREDVSACFLRIAEDPRHRDVQLLSAGDVDERLFAEWSMHYVPSRGGQSKILDRYSAACGFHPADLTSRSVEALARNLSAAAGATAAAKEVGRRQAH